jgi:hypothetical protein
MLVRAGLGVALVVAVAMACLTTATTENGLARYTGQTNNSNSSFTSAVCFSGNTGYLNPSANVADTGRSNDGFELNPTDAYADGGGYASNINNPGDRHRFYNYDISVNSSCAVKGIEVRMDWWLDAVNGENSMNIELSWDGGTNWTSAKTDTVESTSEHTGIVGGAGDTWGRTWTVAQLSNANFRVRLTSNCSGSGCASRDFFLDWVPVTVYYGPS